MGCPFYPYKLNKNESPDITYHAFKRYVYFRKDEECMNIGQEFYSEVKQWYNEARKIEQKILGNDKVEELALDNFGTEFVQNDDLLSNDGVVVTDEMVATLEVSPEEEEILQIKDNDVCILEDLVGTQDQDPVLANSPMKKFSEIVEESRQEIYDPEDEVDSSRSADTDRVIFLPIRPNESNYDKIYFSENLAGYNEKARIINKRKVG